MTVKKNTNSKFATKKSAQAYMRHKKCKVSLRKRLIFPKVFLKAFTVSKVEQNRFQQSK